MSFEEMKKRTCIAFVKILYSPETDRDTSLSWSQVHNNDKNNDIINVVKKEKKTKQLHRITGVTSLRDFKQARLLLTRQT